ncbi:glycosyltransferase [Acetanaerobacterium sp. MSJ-12]|uniref:glycosyltransferase n=1 Tax=Oscillospiraceae TaxID=216572 RepID=UPI00163BB356|nr:MULTISPECIES: glycosyltransferase [Oscillospiraceae]MBC2871085.1 glycosyltransferase [Bittarella massiliensis (ex Durand et al. 2017)]MBU5418765.1 glycosyltransferase [Acetanaerobacterium sp. MSJ-12]
MAFLSIIIPVYNAEKTVGYSIESVLAQKWDDIEIIVVDDGSSDGSLTICKEYEKKDTRIKVIHQENGGPGAARNTGLQNAKGDYIAFVDADDYIENEMYDILLEKLCSTDADVAICGYIREYYKGEHLSACKKVTTESAEVSKKAWRQYFDEWYYKNYFNVLWNKIYKKEVIENYNILFQTDIYNGEDLIFNLSYFAHIQKVVVLDQALYHYVERRGDSLTHRCDPSFFKNKIYLFEAVSKFCQTHFSDSHSYCSIYSVFLRDCFQSIDRYYQDKETIKQIIDHPYTSIAIQNSASANGAFLLYRLALKSRLVWVVRKVSDLRKLFKNHLLGR